MGSTSISLSSRVETSRNWVDLPLELTSTILMRLGSVDILLSARKVCRTWRRICSDPTMWRVVDIKYTMYFFKLYSRLDYDDKMAKVAKKAVDLSAGQMTDFTANRFVSDDLLRYISDRSCQLRRLQVASCYSITDEGLSEMVKKLPLLEELHLYYVPVSKLAIKVIGLCCPHLKSFSYGKLDHTRSYSGCDCDGEALAIAQNMPGLRHLKLCGNEITSDSLLAILENCHHLESLDLRNCFNFSNLEPDLERKLSQLMKDLRLTYYYTKRFEVEASDNTEDYESEASDNTEDYDSDYTEDSDSEASDYTEEQRTLILKLNNMI